MKILHIIMIKKKVHLTLKSKATPRKGWKKAFKKMCEKGDDNLLILDIFEDEIITQQKKKSLN